MKIFDENSNWYYYFGLLMLALVITMAFVTGFWVWWTIAIVRAASLGLSFGRRTE